MELRAIKCPNCGAYSTYEPGATQLFCQYCGAKLIEIDPNKRTDHYIDEARIKEIESRERIRRLEMELEEKKQKANDDLIARVFVLLGLLFGVMSIVTGLTQARESDVAVDIAIGIAAMAIPSAYYVLTRFIFKKK